MDPHNWETHQSKINDLLRAQGIGQHVGAIFLSGRSSLTQGDLCVMGFNPGGDPKNGLTLTTQLEDWSSKEFERFSSYKNECWARG